MTTVVEVIGVKYKENIAAIPCHHYTSIPLNSAAIIDSIGYRAYTIYGVPNAATHHQIVSY